MNCRHKAYIWDFKTKNWGGLGSAKGWYFQLGATIDYFYDSFSPLYSLGSCLPVVYPADAFAASQKVGEKICEGLDQR